MRKWLFLIVLLINSIILFAQKEDRVWCFGFGAGINFNDTSNPVAFQTACYNGDGCSGISDSNGYLLLYIVDSNFSLNGVRNYPSIRGNKNQIIANGDSILFDTGVTNGALFLGVSNNKYVFFHIAFDSLTIPQYTSLYYSIIENGINGLEVTRKNVHLIDQVECKMAAVKHADGNNWWLFLHATDILDTALTCNNTFYSFYIHDTIVEGPFEQNIGLPHCADQNFDENSQGFYGGMTFSRSGSKLASTVLNANAIELFDFDRCSGQLSNYQLINNIGDSSTAVWGTEFSSDETKLYASLINDFGERYNELHQIQLNDSLKNIRLAINSNNHPKYGQLQLAPDNKIYFACESALSYGEDDSKLAVIENPDSLGAACNLVFFDFYLGDSIYTGYGLPNMPNFNLGPLQNSIWQSTVTNDTFICNNIDTPTKGIFISAYPTPNVTVTWQPAQSKDSISATIQLVNPTQSTWYYVTFTDTALQGTCNSRTDSVYVAVKECTEGIQQINSSGQHLNIYPNPAQNFVTAQWQPIVVGDYSLVIYDLLGRQLYNQKVDGALGKTEIDISDLANGLYVVRVLSSAKSPSRSFFARGVGGGKLAIAR